MTDAYSDIDDWCLGIYLPIKNKQKTKTVTLLQTNAAQCKTTLYNIPWT